MRNRPRQSVPMLAAGIATLGLVGGGAPAQMAVQTVGQPIGLEKVQQGGADAGPLNVDLRVQPLDLRSPLGFDAVYRGHRSDAYGARSDFFVRRHGAVSAVFPRSIYTDRGNGIHSAEVPPGTVYYIGDLPPELTGDADAPSGLPLPPVERRPPTPLASGSDALAQAPFDEGIERLAAQRRAEIATDLIRAAAAAEKSRLPR